MSSKRRIGRRSLRLALLTLAIAMSPRAAIALEALEISLDFQPWGDGAGLQAEIGDLGELAEVEQIVLQLSIQALNYPVEDGLLVSLEILCGVGGEEVELLSSMDLFATEAEGQVRLCQFDLSSLLYLEVPSCPPSSAVIRIRSFDESLSLTLDQEDSNASLQVVRR